MLCFCRNKLIEGLVQKDLPNLIIWDSFPSKLSEHLNKKVLSSQYSLDFQLTIDPASDDSQIEDALIVLKEISSAEKIRPKLDELFKFLLKPEVPIKEKIVPSFVVAAFPQLFERCVSGGDENAAILKNAILRGEFPVNLMVEGGVVRLEFQLCSFKLFI